MKKHRLTHRQKSYKVGTSDGVEKSAEHLLEIAGLPRCQNCCTISLKEAHRPEGGAIIAEMIKQSEEKEELLQQEVHRPNLEKLVSWAEDLEEDGTLIPAFLAILEMCFQS